MKFPNRLLLEQGGPGHRGPELPRCDVPVRPLGELLPGVPLRDRLDLPRVSEPEVVRHFIELSTLNHHVDRGFYPLGSCTMKHNPRTILRSTTSSPRSRAWRWRIRSPATGPARGRCA